MTAVVERWATSGLGQWTWYRSRRSVPSRARLPLAAATRSLVGQVGVTLEASTTESRAAGSARARPRRRSESPWPYSSAVSIRVMPRARSTTARASAGPNWVPQPHSGEPNCQAPRPMTDTRRPQAST